MEVIDRLMTRYPQLLSCRDDIKSACELLTRVFADGKYLFICGNGGSAADAMHIAGELVKSFVIKRPLDKVFTEQVEDKELLRNLQGALPVFSLVENTAFATAFSNDCAAEYVYAQQVYAYARDADCIWGISTSGNSKNIIHAIGAAKGRGAVALGLTGAGGGEMKSLCDVCICVPETETFKVQELHLPVYHTICLALEDYFWGG